GMANVDSRPRRRCACRAFESNCRQMRFARQIIVMVGAVLVTSLVQAILEMPRAHAGDTPDPSQAPGATAAQPDGPVPDIVLYTMGKCSVVWEKFGHAALCVEYRPESRRPSLCYNYGTTDFTAPVSVGW